MQEGTDFIVYEIAGHGYHWEGKGIYEDYCSDKGFDMPSEAAADAMAFLQSLDDDTDTEPECSDLCA